MGETIAERLRERAGEKFNCIADVIAAAITGERASCTRGCRECHRKWLRRLADAIEAEQVADIFKPIPEGIEWPRFEDGTPVKFGDEFVKKSGDVDTLHHIHFFNDNAQLNLGDFIEYGERLKRPEPEVLDADGVRIKVGDTVWDGKGESHEVVSIDIVDMYERLIWCGKYLNGVKVYHIANELTHRKPDTQEAIEADAAKAACLYFHKGNLYKCSDCPQGNGDGVVDYRECCIAQTRDLLRRQLKLLGGER